MSRLRHIFLALMALGCLYVAAGCGTIRETLPDRAAKEQLVISSAADRAVDEMPEGPLGGVKIYVDTTNLEGTDKVYVVQTVRDYVLANDAALAGNAEEADVVLELASGALSLDKRNYLLGLPAIPLPIPMAGETLQLPEIPLMKALFYRGKVKLQVSAIDTQSRAEAFEVPICRGKSLDSYWWVFFFGPFRYSDIPMEQE